MSDQIQIARTLAHVKHVGQLRRDGKTPYIMHLVDVVQRLDGEHDRVIAAAWLHDILEKTTTSILDLQKADLHPQVIETVIILTKDKSQPYDEYITCLCRHSDARIIKRADIISNLSDTPHPQQLRKYGLALYQMSFYAL